MIKTSKKNLVIFGSGFQAKLIFNSGIANGHQILMKFNIKNS